MEHKKRILIQGALDIEIEYMLSLLQNKRITKIKNYEFFLGTIFDIHVVISKTLVGTINSTIATTLGILRFNPDIVINQGIAGAHKENIHVGDIIIGETCCNINAYKMPTKEKGQGSNPFEWELNKRANDVKMADKNLVNIFHHNISTHTVYKGVLGSGDVFNREYDRIIWTTQIFDSLCEDMESIGIYTACHELGVPCIGIRIISNNELLQEKLDKQQAIELQKVIINLLPLL